MERKDQEAGLGSRAKLPVPTGGPIQWAGFRPGALPMHLAWPDELEEEVSWPEKGSQLAAVTAWIKRQVGLAAALPDSLTQNAIFQPWLPATVRSAASPVQISAFVGRWSDPLAQFFLKCHRIY